MSSCIISVLVCKEQPIKIQYFNIGNNKGKYSDCSFEVRTERMRFVRKAKVRIFSRMDRTNWPIRALLYDHNQRPKPSSNSTLNIFVSFPVSSLNAVVRRSILSNFSVSFKIKISFKKPKLAYKHFARSFCLFQLN